MAVSALSLEEFLNLITRTIQSAPSPPQQPTMFGAADKIAVYLLAGDPIALARATIKKFKLHQVVIAAPNTTDTVLVMHAEDRDGQRLVRVYSIPEWILRSEDPQATFFESLF